MDQKDLLKKIEQIETHAQDALSAYPHLAVERLRLILSLARCVRGELIQPIRASAEEVRQRRVA